MPRDEPGGICCRMAGAIPAAHPADAGADRASDATTRISWQSAGYSTSRRGRPPKATTAKPVKRRGRRLRKTEG